MAKEVIHISEAEAANDFAALMARVRAGAKVIIENGTRPVAVLHAAEPVRRTISECIALAKAHVFREVRVESRGLATFFFVEEILSHREPWPPGVEIILDSSIIIAAERRGRTAQEILEQGKARPGGTNSQRRRRRCRA